VNGGTHSGTLPIAGGWRERAVACLGFGALTVLLTFPLAWRLGSVGRVDNGDGQYAIWVVSWVARTLIVDPLHVFDANIFYPHRWTLAYSESNLGAGSLAVPVYWLTHNPYAAFNFVTLLSFVFSAVGTYYLVRYLTGSRPASVVSAICFAYCPYVFAHTPHMQLLWTAGLPFSMLAFHRLADAPSPGRAAALGLTMAVQALFCGYYGVFVMLMVGFAVLMGAAWRHRWMDGRYWMAVAIAAAVAVAATVPLLAPYLLMERGGVSRSLESANQWSADWRAYLASSSYAHAWMLRIIGHWKEVLFPGFVAVALGVPGVAVGWGARDRLREVSVLYGGLGLLALWASFGPQAGLYSVLYSTIPLFGFLRAPSRLAIIVILALSVLAGVTISVWRSRWTAAATAPRKAGVSRIAVATVVLTAFAVLERLVPMPFVPALREETAYRILATLPRGPLIELPMYSARFAFGRTRYMLSSTTHWMPLVSGYSDYIPADHAEKLDALAGFPTADALRRARQDGVRYAIVHLDAYMPAARAELLERLDIFAPYLLKHCANERIRLYEIIGSPP
jgi:hypothetical protein